jgi:hypothetical protein
MKERAEDLVKAAVKDLGEGDTDKAKIRDMYHRVLDRDPSPQELDLAQSYLGSGAKLTEYAQALLATNEVIFWP